MAESKVYKDVYAMDSRYLIHTCILCEFHITLTKIAHGNVPVTKSVSSFVITHLKFLLFSCCDQIIRKMSKCNFL